MQTSSGDSVSASFRQGGARASISARNQSRFQQDDAAMLNIHRVLSARKRNRERQQFESGEKLVAGKERHLASSEHLHFKASCFPLQRTEWEHTCNPTESRSSKIARQRPSNCSCVRRYRFHPEHRANFADQVITVCNTSTIF